ncbi:bifunctional diguanylate cyclase/phosphodiesterase [Neobacillus endophyticus]|uniref:bifunctional diguanylate cyclase/phosphodiesterase n=1 Tax=Neobacillus endophyticus TaxID=2738405 RepID=UPI001C267C12|nr:GGDEF domain-containing phosphodiesterase [Neobacillus endophyticus]
MIYLIPPLIDYFYRSDHYFSNTLWFLYLIPAFIIVFLTGFKYSWMTIGTGSLSFLLMKLFELHKLGTQELVTFTELLFVNFLITVCVGILVKQNQEKQTELKKTKNLQESIFNNLDIAIWSISPEKDYLLSRGVEKIYGLPLEKVLEDNNFWKNNVHPEDLYFTEEIDQKWADLQSYVYEYRIVQPDGSFRWIRDRGVPVLNENGTLQRYDGTNLDITPQKELELSLKKSEERYKYLAYHDSLTELPNMNYLYNQIFKKMDQAKAEGIPASLMFFNLDRFKLINDSFGHPSGDQILKLVSRRLENRIPENGTVLRAGSDEFIIYLHGTKKQDAEGFAKYLLQSFSEPFQLGNQEIRIGASIGIAMLRSEETLDDLLQEASAALHVAKEHGGNHYQIFSTDFRQKANRKLQVDQQLRKAIEQKVGLEIYYQPKLDLFSNKVAGMEALARWTDPILGIVSPGEFIPVAEETGLINLIGKWVLEESCKQNMEFIKSGFPPMHVCVNISSRQFLQEDFISMVEDILEESGLPPKYLNLEITERIALYNVEDAIEKLKKLKQLGVSISLDDFGTGYSSLSYIKSLPIDVLKIDRSFIIDIIESKQDHAIIHSVISLAHSLGLTVVAEGVETEHQLNILGNLSCDEIQGYYYAKPMAAKDYKHFLINYKEKADLLLSVPFQEKTEA